MTEQQTVGKGSARALVTPERFDAVLFDLDGVVTDTARVHAEAWARTFNEFLERRGREEGRPLAPFTLEDYRSYVDGLPRSEGVRRFLAARGISLPEGSPADGAGQDTVYGLSARKTGLFLAHIRTHGVQVYPSTIELIHQLRSLGVRTALVTASRNRAEILCAARVEPLFDATVDGNDRQALGLRGKPAPDTYLEAARRLAASPARSVVVEDAIAGVEAGRAGGFGLVIGVDRSGDAGALKAHGADVVVPDLSMVDVATHEAAPAQAPPSVAEAAVRKAAGPGGAATDEAEHDGGASETDPWVLAYDGFDPTLETRRETLFALGNGYFVTRGAAAEARADDIHYPGTYLAGGYNRLTSTIDGQPVEHEDLVNMPNWLPLTIRIEDGDWLDLRQLEILAYRQSLDLRRGLYERCMHVRDGRGRETRVVERRFVHMGDRHLAGQHVAIVAGNWSGRLVVRAMLDGDVANAGVPRYRAYRGTHVRVLDTTVLDPESVMLEAETTQSHLRIAQAARIRVCSDVETRIAERRVVREPARVGQEIVVELSAGERVDLEKIVALHSSRDRASADSATEARTTLGRAGSFDELLASQALAWTHLWRRCDLDAVEVDADAFHHTHLIVRLHVFHLLQTASMRTMELDVGIPARGWHGEGYRGHIFWDELFILPFLSLRMPLLARALLLYRYRRLPEARWAAREAGYRGAMFPWQSGSNGSEETDVAYFNPLAGDWIRDDTHLQRHVGAAIAYNVWHYYQATGDDEFLFVYGAELLCEIARFWASIAQWNDARGRYDIRGVVGPDEFHVRYPGRATPGLDNNAYTNVMASWCLIRARDALDLLPTERRRELSELLALGQDEIERWADVSRKLYLPFHSDGILSQFEGYEALEELDWEDYRRRYGDIARLDLILNAEGDSPDRYKLSKQADVLMLFYLFSARELQGLFERLGYPFDAATIPGTINYYLARTSHGSTLSGVVHAWVLARSCRPRSWRIFLNALHSDIDDIQGGTTAEGIHLGAMAGTVDLLQRCYTGLELRGGELRFHPVLPDELDRISFDLRYRQQSLSIDFTPSTLTVASAPGAAAAITIVVDDQSVVVDPGARKVIPLAQAGLDRTDGCE